MTKASSIASSTTTVLQKRDDPQADKIRDEIMRMGNAIRDKYPFLERHQDAIGLTILLVSSAVACFGAYATLHGLLPYWISFLIVALATSIVHEIEHDAIHNLYFNGSLVNDFMLGLGWLVRLNAVNPWTRRRFHFHHHKASGTESDLEEQGITNGEPWGPKRILMLADAGLAFWLRPFAVAETSKKYRLAQGALTRAENVAIFVENACAHAPFACAHYFMLYAFVAFHGLNWYYASDAAAAAILPGKVVEWMPVFAAYLWSFGFPNAFRLFCLVTVSSNMHYFADIKAGEVMKQTQIWNTWLTFPLDLFTFNFGSTHCIHHFVTRDTFYIRQMMAPSLYAFMKANGVRTNDFDTIFRANHYSKEYREWRLL